MGNNIERRLYPRIDYPCKIHISIKKNLTITTHTKNISKGGACVVFTKNPGVYTELEMKLELPGKNFNIKCQAAVIWVLKKYSFNNIYPTRFYVGLKFLNIKPEEKEKIGRFVDSIFFKQNQS